MLVLFGGNGQTLILHLDLLRGYKTQHILANRSDNFIN